MNLSQLFFVVVLIGGPILSIRIVRSGAKEDLGRPLTFLSWSFWGAIFSFALAMGAATLFETSAGTGLMPVVVANSLLIAFYLFACVYWTSLGVLAHRTGRSWILWIAAGLATLALGFVATYILMRSRVRAKLNETK